MQRRSRAASSSGQPVRRCAGCGRRRPQRELVRFAARDGVLVAGRNEPGRGAYTCRDQACFERAAGHGGFARALRTGVGIDPAFARLYTEAFMTQERDG